MSDDLNLPASLQRLEITPERSETVSKSEENNPFSVLNISGDQTECFLENLSLKAVCSKGNCQCNKNKENKEEDDVMKKLKGTQRKTVLRRSRLNNVLLKAAVLKLGDIKETTSSEKTQALSEISKSEPHFPVKALRDEGSEGSRSQSQGPGKSLLRAPVLRVDPLRERPQHLPRSNRSCTSEESTTQRPPAMCAVQARNPSPDDTNIEELASYFDLFVHIPKKMSVMAEMMYI